MSDTALLIQLPVPSFVPEGITGNIPLGPADLVLHAKTSSRKLLYEPLLAPQTLFT